jgi:hypothetical protein
VKINAGIKAAIIASAEAVSAAAIVIGLMVLRETGVLAWLACAMAGAVVLAALLIHAFEMVRQNRALERWAVECSEAERWLAEFPEAVDALHYVRTAATVGGIDIGWHRERMRQRARVRDHVHHGVQAATTGPVPDHTEAPPMDGDMLVRHAARSLSPAELDALARDWSRQWDTPLPASGVSYKFLSAECADAS